MPKRKTHLEFVKQANIIHNNKYLYVQTYIRDEKILIICPIHGEFAQKASSHLQGCGCPKCAIDLRALRFKRSYFEFIEKANLIHNNKYIYLGEYKNSHTKILIKCSIHGTFKQTPDKHLRGNGCPKCAGKIRKTKKEFIEEAIIVHGNKYNYHGEYINARTNIIIECPKHGIFKQIPDVHLNGCGCPCCSSNVSKMEKEWLDSLNIPNDNKHRSVRLQVGNSYIKPDGFIPETNTIYEFYGDYFHGNLKIYDPDFINHKNKKTMKNLYNETIKRQDMIKSLGYNLVFIWENDWKEKKKKIKYNEQNCTQKNFRTS